MNRADIRPGVMRLFRLALQKPRDVSAETSEEIEFHLEQRVQQLVALGLDESDARREASRRFGNVSEAQNSLVTLSTRRNRALHLRNLFTDLLQDIRFAQRTLARSPAFVAIAVGCLALGIGANVAIFAVVDGVLLKSLPYREPGQLVRVWNDGTVPPGIFDLVERGSHSYSMLAGVEGGRPLTLTGAGEPVRVVASQTTARFFDVLGSKAELGRTFTSTEANPGAPAVAVISHGLWQSHFGGDSLIVGKTLRLDGSARTIVGVMPAEFSFPDNSVDLWTPAKFDRTNASYWWSTYFMLVGRLKPGVTATHAEREAALVFPQSRKSFPMRMPDAWGQNVTVVPLQESLTGRVRPTILLLYGAVAVVLLIACVNVAALFLSRTHARAREIAVRIALGAGRSRIVRLLSIESLMVALLGALIGLIFAWVGLRLLVSLLPANTPRIGEIAIGFRAFGMTLLLTAGSATLFGVLPVLRSTRRGLESALKSDNRTGMATGAIRVSSALAIAQNALAVTLMTGAGLLIKSLWELKSVELGFDTRAVSAAAIPLPSFANDTATRAPQFYDQVLAQTQAIPGVKSAALASALPFGDGPQNSAMAVEAHPTSDGDVPPLPQFIVVSPDYFNVFRIPLRAGRQLNNGDREGTLRVGVIDEIAAHKMWPGEHAIGQRIRMVWNQDWITIVGIVGNVKRDSMSSEVEPTMYVPAQQSSARTMYVVMRSAGSAAALSTQLQKVVSHIDRTVPVGDVRELSGVVSRSASQQQFVAILLISFASAALVLGAVGIYGVVNASVARRTREIGVRMALGATSKHVMQSVLQESLWLSAAGVLSGLLGAAAFSRLLRGSLYGVGVTDVTVLASVAILLALVAVGAALAPALRASRIDPLLAIRID